VESKELGRGGRHSRIVLSLVTGAGAEDLGLHQLRILLDNAERCALGTMARLSRSQRSAGDGASYAFTVPAGREICKLKIFKSF